jgi:3-methyl-2-oxobutanoate hydroxymethyltransferase
MPEKITAPRVRAMKQKGEKIVCLTAYDAPFAALVDRAGVDLVLVGDSVGNVVLGYDSTLGVTLEHMVHHTKAVRAGVRHALLVGDLPFGSYQESPEQAVRSAVALVRAGAEAVKLEGLYEEAVAAIVRAGIPVMGHLGMTPQSVHQFGGFRVQGKGEEGEAVVDAAKALEAAGAFSIVLELIPASLSRRVTGAVSIPTIGIGAGEGCDGQIQVLHDVLGFGEGRFRHAKRYVEGASLLGEAIARYAQEVRGGTFPEEEHSF